MDGTCASNHVRTPKPIDLQLTPQAIRDFTATSLIGPHATPAQTLNNQLVGCLYHVWYNLTFVEQDFPGKVWETMSPSVEVGLCACSVGGGGGDGGGGR